MDFLLYFLSFTISVAMWLKLIEMLYHMKSYYADGMIPSDDHPITNLISKIFPQKVLSVLFRYKTIMLLLILLQLFAAQKYWTFAFSGWTLFFAIWTQILRILVDQIKYGSFIYFSGNSLSNPWNQNLVSKKSVASKNLNSFIYIFLGQCMYVIFGYACLFNTLNIFTDKTAFHSNLLNDSLGVWEFIYFSTVTFATVGYGDITPSTYLLSRLLTVSEILLSIIIVIIFIASVSLTFSGDEKNNT